MINVEGNLDIIEINESSNTIYSIKSSLIFTKYLPRAMLKDTTAPGVLRCVEYPFKKLTRISYHGAKGLTL